MVAIASAEEVGECGFLGAAASLRNPMRIQHPLIPRCTRINLTYIHRDTITMLMGGVGVMVMMALSIAVVRHCGRLSGLSLTSLSFPCHGNVLLLDAVIMVGHETTSSLLLGFGCWMAGWAE